MTATYNIAVVCDDQSHPGKVATICRFWLTPGSDRWTERVDETVDAEQFSDDLDAYGFDAASDLAGEPHRASRVLYVDRLLDATDSHGFGQRINWNLHCKLCKLTVPAIDEKLQPHLNRLGDAGVFRISLSGLAAILPS